MRITIFNAPSRAKRRGLCRSFTAALWLAASLPNFFGGELSSRTASAADGHDRVFEERVFGLLVDKYRDRPFDELYSKLQRSRLVAQSLTFDPTGSKYFDRVKKGLGLSDEEVAMLKRNGFVALDLNRPNTFGTAYYEIYRKDLPVFVTSDSILHAMHRSFDKVLSEIEATWFAPTLSQILEVCHDSLARRASQDKGETIRSSLRDVDLYITVARNLLAGAGGPAVAAGRADKPNPCLDQWDGRVLVSSKLKQDEEVLGLLKSVQSLALQGRSGGASTAIYGGARRIDYSQFRPRGHYTSSNALSRYFRCMMWLGRPDCGWNILPKDSNQPADQSAKVDADREFRNSVLMAELVRESNGLESLWAVEEVMDYLIGPSDNLTTPALLEVMRDQKVETLEAAADDASLARLRDAIRSRGSAQRLVRSELDCSNPDDPYTKVPPADKFQFFGQRFTIDSFILSQVVYDSILDQGRKVERMMPKGLDVMVALGNDAAVPLLKDELKEWSYGANLLACRELVGLYKPSYWGESLYNIWLDCLRTLDDDMSGSPNFPEAMLTRSWQMKQLQTQHASWAELHHDTILYTSQPYSMVMCEYLDGYVEPYPQFFARVKSFSNEAARLLAKGGPKTKKPVQAQLFAAWVNFFTRMGQIVGRLESLSQKELNAEPFTSEDIAFLKKTIDARGGGSGPPRYDGWYPDLFYERLKVTRHEPTVADVHTDPQGDRVLEVAVGDANFGVIAVNNGPDQAVYVGPIYSYYEFQHPAQSRLTDAQWNTMLRQGRASSRPTWTQSFLAPVRPSPPSSGKPR